MLTPFAKLTTANDISREYYPKIWNERNCERVSFIYMLHGCFVERSDMKSEQREMRAKQQGLHI